MTSRTWFITGASRGIGLEIAKAALQNGDNVVATARKAADAVAALGEQEQVLALDLDVTVPAQIATAVEKAKARFGGIDVLVNNAGYGHIGIFEETADNDARVQFDTNVFGLFDVTRAVLPVMRAQRRGHVINLSSVAGIVGYAGASLYCASKFAVEGFSLSLADEVKPFGIDVTIVGPGFIRTDFLDPRSIRKVSEGVADYAELSAQIDGLMAYSHHQPGDPVRLAQAVVQLASRPNPPRRFSAGSDAVQLVDAQLGKLKAELDADQALSSSVDGQWQ